MSDPNTQQDRTLAVTLSVVSAVLIAKVADAQLDLLTKFGRLIGAYKVGDLLHLGLRKTAQGTARQLMSELPPLVEQVIAAAVKDGVAAGQNGTGNGGVPPDNTDPFAFAGDSYESHAERSARAIREDLQGKLNQLGYPITRFADDAYRAVVADAAEAQVRGLTPAQAQGHAYRDLTRRGIDGFTDSLGRKWELSAYVEAAVRSAVQRAFNVSHLDRMLSEGVELFTVTDDGDPCPLCEPWQGKILSVNPDDRADATIAEATAAGLFHVRCKHTLVAFFPGVTVLPEPHVWNADDQRKYVESQRQRAIERSIRAAKRELAGAPDDASMRAAQKSVRDAQAVMRAFIDSTGRVRNSRREQLSLGNKP